MKMNVKKKFIFFTLFLTINCFFDFIQDNSSPLFVEKYLNIDPVKFSIGKDTIECEKCIPTQIKMTKNGTLFCNFPSLFPNTTIKYSLAKYNNNTNSFEPWPPIITNTSNISETDDIFDGYDYFNENIKINDKDNNDTIDDDENDTYIFNSVYGFEVDSEDNFYIIDHDPKEINEDKFYKYNKNGKKIFEYSFKELNITLNIENSLSNLVIDKENNFIYLSDSGQNYNSQNISEYDPSIIVIDLNKNMSYKILSGNESLMPDKTFSLFVNNTLINPYYPIKAATNNIALSCDGETLFYCSLFSRMIYSVKTKEIKNKIDIYNKNKEIYPNILNKIEFKHGYKKEATDSFLASSRGNLYMTGIESGSIYIIKKIEQNLLRLDYKDFSHYTTNNNKDENDSFNESIKMIWPNSMTINNGYLYILSNQMNNVINYNESDSDISESNNGFSIFKLNISRFNDNPYINGCTGFKYKNNILLLSIWVCFAFVIFIVLCFVFVDSGNPEKDKNLDWKKKD